MQWLARVFAAAVVRRLAVVVVGLLVLAVGQCAHASVPKVQPPATYCNTAYDACPNGGGIGTPSSPYVVHGGTAQQACDGYVRWTWDDAGRTGTLIAQATPGRFLCSGGYAGNTLQLVPESADAVCPDHSTSSSGSYCECTAPYVENAGHTACVPAPDACEPKLAQPLGAAGQEFTYPVSAKAVPSRICSGGCGYIPSGAAGSGAAMFTQLGTAYNYVAMSAADWIGDGSSCTAAPVGSPGTPPSTPPQADPTPPPPGKCKGTVNGVEVVVDCDGTTTTSGTSGPGSSSGSASGASGTSSTGSTSTTSCSGSTCTTTTTTTTTGGSGTTTSTDTKNEDKGDFCAEHPGNPQCQDEDDPCEGSGSVGCMKPGTLEATPLQTTIVPLSITPSEGYGPSNATCPAPQTATLLGHTYSFSWQPFCDLATGIRPVVLALAWLSAAIGFLGLSRKGN